MNFSQLVMTIEQGGYLNKNFGIRDDFERYKREMREPMEVKQIVINEINDFIRNINNNVNNRDELMKFKEYEVNELVKIKKKIFDKENECAKEYIENLQKILRVAQEYVRYDASRKFDPDYIY